MEECNLGELFEVKILNLRKALMEINDYFYDYNDSSGNCSFMQSVVLISTVKPTTIQYVVEQAQVFRRMYCLVNVAPNIVSTKYVYYYLLGNKAQLERLYIGTTIENLSVTNLRNLKIRIPSMAEQLAIVKNMDVVDNIIEKQSKAVAKINEVFGAYYQRAYLVNSKYWSKKKLILFSKKKIYNRRSANFEVIPKEDGVMLSVGRDVFLKIDKKICNPYYLSAVLKEAVVTKFQRNGKWTDVTLSGLSISDLQEIFVPLPPLEVQNDYEVMYKKISNIKEYMEDFLWKVRELYEIMLFKLLYRNSLEKNVSQFKANLNKLSKTVLKYSYEEPQTFISLSAYDEARRLEYADLASGRMVQIFDDKKKKIILMRI